MAGIIKAVAFVVLLAAVFGAGWLLATSGAGRGVDPASLTDLEREFAENMQNVVLEGFFTIERRHHPPGDRARLVGWRHTDGVDHRL